jgi:transcriptional regulator with XRE-family HTH domain
VTQTIGGRIAQARRQLGVEERRDLARTEIAEACGVDPSMISLYELGKNVPREDALTKLADFLGVTPAYLRYGVPNANGTAEARQAAEADVISRGGGGSFTPLKTLAELHATKQPTAKKVSRRKAGGEGKGR